MEKTLFTLQFDTSDQLEVIKKETFFKIIYITEPRHNLGFYQPGEVICALNQTTAA